MGRMAHITKIIIKGESGYAPVEESYRDKITIDHDSIRYKYKPEVESDFNVPRKWSYKTSSPIFRKLFTEAAAAVEEILKCEEMPLASDLGTTTFTLVYADKRKVKRSFTVPGDEFRECFSIIKQMVPGCEYVPAVLLTSEDYEEEG